MNNDKPPNNQKKCDGYCVVDSDGNYCKNVHHTEKKIYDWLHEKYLNWRLKQVYPNGVSEEEYQEATRKLIRRKV